MTKLDIRFLHLTFLVLLATLSSTPVAARDFVLVVSGIGGEDSYETEFSRTIGLIRDAYVDRTGQSAVDVALTVMQGDEVTRDSLTEKFETLVGDITEEDVFIMMLLGHGSFDGEDYRFNIPGPDLTGQELKRLTQAVKAKRKLLVLATSGSGAMLKSLEGPGHVVITATKNGTETNAVRFPAFWAEALLSGKADYDRNEIVTAREAFRFATEGVAKHFSDQNLLATEHARLVAKDTTRISVTRTGSLRGTGKNPVVTALLEQRSELEAELAVLIELKPTLSQNDYFDKLEILMLKMARLQRKLDVETGWTAEGSEPSDLPMHDDTTGQQEDGA